MIHHLALRDHSRQADDEWDPRPALEERVLATPEWAADPVTPLGQLRCFVIVAIVEDTAIVGREDDEGVFSQPQSLQFVRIFRTVPSNCNSASPLRPSSLVRYSSLGNLGTWMSLVQR